MLLTDNERAAIVKRAEAEEQPVAFRRRATAEAYKQARAELVKDRGEQFVADLEAKIKERGIA